MMAEYILPASNPTCRLNIAPGRVAKEYAIINWYLTYFNILGDHGRHEFFFAWSRVVLKTVKICPSQTNYNFPVVYVQLKRYSYFRMHDFQIFRILNLDRK